MLAFSDLENKLIDECRNVPPNFSVIKSLVSQGADINAVNEYDQTVLEEIVLGYLFSAKACDHCESGLCYECEYGKTEHLLDIIDFFVENGWDSVRFGLRCIGALSHSTHDKTMFYAAKKILECPLSEDVKAFEDALESIGTEESFQRCCEHNPKEENLYYTTYEMVEAKMNGLSTDGFDLFYSAIGLKVEKIVSFSEDPKFIDNGKGTVFFDDIGFICNDKVLVLRPSINIQMMNHRINDNQTDIVSAFGEGFVGYEITDISFDNVAIIKENKEYNQQVIYITYSTGKKIKFTHNFAEAEGEEVQARFEIVI